MFESDKPDAELKLIDFGLSRHFDKVGGPSCRQGCVLSVSRPVVLSVSGSNRAGVMDTIPYGKDLLKSVRWPVYNLSS